MKEYTIKSKKYGVYLVLLDDIDYEFLKKVGGRWCVCKMRDKFYIQKRFSDNKVKQLHRFLMQAKFGEYVDHINGDTLDNRRENLRICTNAANIRNGRIRTNNTSGAKGVYWHKRDSKWIAFIKVNYKNIYLGRFKDFKDAVEARYQAEKIYWSI